jgi:mono/diheme cytochrome c family protein
MSEQPRYNPLAPSNFFADGRSERPVVPGTVAHGAPPFGDPLYTGRVNGEVLERIPVPITRELLERGRERFDIYCSPCHGRTGDGRGMIVRRGFRQPPSYHIQRLLNAPDGHFFEVITKGFGEMYSYADRVAPADRWAVIAYIRALQLSQAARLDDVPSPERGRLLGSEK